MITQDRLKELLHYDPDTGIFRWKIRKPYTSIKPGQKAGKTTQGYNHIGIDGKGYKAARLAFLYMEGYFPENLVDHENQITTDDRWENLREASKQCNARNSKIQSNNTSGVKGVGKENKKWKVYIWIMGKPIRIGLFADFSDAVKARWEAEKEYGFPNCCTSSSAYLYLKEHGYVD